MTLAPIANCMDNGTITAAGETIRTEDIDWQQHPTYKGVHLKHLVRGESTNGQLSCHMVKVDPGCTLELHTHAAQWELHEVIDGAGICTLDGSVIPYAPGQVTVIPCGTPHAVTAESDGLVMLAKFFPALC
ncbi:MAG TPA: cupin domain-containing protein [Aggregatilinea sp.]|uniref:cupin domain-containing protein n=1 Tax=Aggregatilinea sp. TaxID=2806333 RepID=UPI002BED735A|nr:cupin domain-containing protein [Aggregatilinea sp.]HML23802.1 cupin domain-containing protein [Aggregatilinea sp.]